MKTVFVTGANGFIGNALIDHLTKSDWEIYALLRPGTVPSFILKDNIHIVYGDLTDKKSLLKALPENCYVVNLAANPYHSQLSYQVNVEGTRNLCEVARAKKVKKIIQISSQATKIEYKGVYAITKSQADEVVKKSKLKHVILKPSLVYGPGEKGLFNKVRLLIEKIPFIPVFGDGKVKVDVIYVDDICRIINYVLEDEENINKVWDAGSGSQITYNDYYLSIAHKIGKKIRLIHIPVFIGLFLGRLMSKFLANPPFYVDNILGSTQSTNCNPSPLLQRYSFKPLSWEQGVKKIFGKKKINVAVVGLGKMGTLHLTLLNMFPEVKVCVLIDTNKQLYSTIRSMGISGNYYTTLEEAVNKEKIDAVYITTPTFTHFKILKTAVKNNLDVFIEKPVSLNAKQIEILKNIKTNSKIHVGYTLLFNKVYRKVDEIIKSKKYGKILSFSAKFEHGEVFGPKKGWMFTKKLSGGGVMMNPGPHLFSLVNLYFGKPKKISGKILKKYSVEVDDEARLNFDYENFQGDIFLSWSIKNKPVSETTFKINFEKATLTCNGERIEIKASDRRLIEINRELVDDLIEDIFNLNPKANGDAYFIEDKLFIEAILKNKKENLNSLIFALSTESLIYECYKVTGNS